MNRNPQQSGSIQTVTWMSLWIASRLWKASKSCTNDSPIFIPLPYVERIYVIKIIDLYKIYFIEIGMNSKRNKIGLLKSKLIEIQHDLNTLQKQDVGRR
jgi:hypothetical protein